MPDTMTPAPNSTGTKTPVPSALSQAKWFRCAGADSRMRISTWPRGSRRTGGAGAIEARRLPIRSSTSAPNRATSAARKMTPDGERAVPLPPGQVEEEVVAGRGDREQRGQVADPTTRSCRDPVARGGGDLAGAAVDDDVGTGWEALVRVRPPPRRSECRAHERGSRDATARCRSRRRARAVRGAAARRSGRACARPGRHPRPAARRPSARCPAAAATSTATATVGRLRRRPHRDDFAVGRQPEPVGQRRAVERHGLWLDDRDLAAHDRAQCLVGQPPYVGRVGDPVRCVQSRAQLDRGACRSTRGASVLAGATLHARGVAGRRLGAGGIVAGARGSSIAPADGGRHEREEHRVVRDELVGGHPAAALGGEHAQRVRGCRHRRAAHVEQSPGEHLVPVRRSQCLATTVEQDEQLAVGERRGWRARRPAARRALRRRRGRAREARRGAGRPSRRPSVAASAARGSILDHNERTRPPGVSIPSSCKSAAMRPPTFTITGDCASRFRVAAPVIESTSRIASIIGATQRSSSRGVSASGNVSASGPGPRIGPRASACERRAVTGRLWSSTVAPS